MPLHRSPLLALCLLAACGAPEAPSTGAPARAPAGPDADQPTDAAWARSYVQGMDRALADNHEMAQINALEGAVAEAERAVLAPFARALRARDAAAAQRLYAGAGVGLRWASAKATTVRDQDGVLEQRLELEPGADELGQLLGQLSAVDHVALDVVDVELAEGGAVSLTVRFDLRGARAAGGRQQDRGYLAIDLGPGPDRVITKISAIRMERLSSARAPSFTDQTAALGLAALPSSDRKEAIRRGGYALVAADVDNDARPDLLVGNYGPLQLLRNTGAGFVDITAKAGLASEGTVKSAAFADLDGDGDRDIVLLRFVVGQTDPRGDFVAYENKGDGTFAERKGVLPRRRQYDRAMPMTLADFDGDGRIDVYIGFPGIRDFTSGIAGRGRPSWLAAQGVWFNRGGWTFSEAADGDAVVSENDVYAHAALASDIDNDGDPDLLVVDDSGRSNPVYRNDGQGGWTQATEAMGMGKGGLSMGMAAGDFNNDGLMDVMTTNVTLTAGQRMATATEGLLDPQAKMGKVMESLRGEYTALTLYQNKGDGTFTDVTATTAGLEWAGDAAAAGEWIDFNHDGLLDYYLPNGLWSGGEERLDSLFFRSEVALYGDAILGYATAPADRSDPMPNDVHGRPIFATNGGPNPILSVLRNDAATAGPGLRWSMGGRQRNALFRNNGDGSFTEVGYLEGADRIEDGYIVAPVDINGDGRQDLVLRNTDPAPGVQQASVVALVNQHGGQTLTLRLRAASGNTDGVGAMVQAKVGGRTISREVRSVTGAVQAEPLAWIGLGEADVVDELTVRWPDGSTQVLREVQPGRLELTQAAE
jgi:hypothetical protein